MQNKKKNSFCKIQNWTYILHIHHLIYERSVTTEKQTQALLEMPSTNLTGKEPFRKQALIFDIFNKTVLNILRNFIPQEIIVYDDKDPPWFNYRTKIWDRKIVRFIAVTKIIVI